LILVARLIPTAVLSEARELAKTSMDRPTSRWAALIIVAIWLLAAGLVWFFIARVVDSGP
jgi:hypothetical protein